MSYPKTSPTPSGWKPNDACGKLIVMDTQQPSQVLDRLLDPFADCLTPDVALAVANFRARPDVQARIDELAEKCNAGELTPVEHAEYRDLVEAIDFISILQAKARARLARAADA